MPCDGLVQLLAAWIHVILIGMLIVNSTSTIVYIYIIYKGAMYGLATLCIECDILCHSDYMHFTMEMVWFWF